MCLLAFLEMQNKKQPTTDSKSLEYRQDKKVLLLFIFNDEN